MTAAPSWTVARRDRRCALASLFAAIERGEILSCTIAEGQAEICADPRSRRALLGQARQEAFHAKVFKAARSLLGVQHPPPALVFGALAEYERVLNMDLRQRNLVGTLVGLQAMLEGIGSVVLEPPRTNFARMATSLVPVRGALLRQEQAHYRHGMALLRNLAEQSARGRRDAATAYANYRPLAEAVVAASIAIFDGSEVDQMVYRAAADNALDALAAVIAPEAVT